MKKLFFVISMIVFTIMGCTKFEEPTTDPQKDETISSIVRTRASASHQVNPDNPYSLSNVQRALRTIPGYSTATLSPTHKYVRFLPQDSTDMYILVDSLDLDIFPYPMDYELTSAEMDMHESATINGYTWQYCLVPPTFQMPSEMTGQLLDYAYLQSDEPGGTRAPSEQLDHDVYGTAIDKAMELTGNSTPQTRASVWQPSAKISYNSGVTGEATMGLKNVLVRANTFFNSGEGYTDGNGNVTISRGWGGRFRNKTQYKIIWATDKWKIHDGFGKSKYEGPKQKSAWSFVINGGESSEVAMCTTMHRALNAYFNESFQKTNGLVKPSFLNVRARWNEVDEKSNANGFFSSWKYNQIHIFSHNCVGNVFTPRDNKEILSTTFHELGHASHWQAVIDWPGMNRNTHFHHTYVKETWARGVQYAYISSIYPNNYIDVISYFSTPNPDDYKYPNDYTAFIESLMNQGLSLNTLQNIFMGKRYLEDCIQPIKALGVVPDAIVDLIFSDACRYTPLRINLANPITGATNPALNTQTTYTIPVIITIGYNANAPYGTSFNGWTVSPNSGYTISGGTGGRNLTIKFTAYRTYTLSANFTLPGNVPYVVSKSVVVSPPPPLSIPHITSDKIRVQQGAYVTFSVTNHPVSNGLVTYQWEVDGVIGSSDGSSISVSATARPSLYALQPSEGEWTMAVRCRSSGDGTNFTNWCAPVSVIVSP